MEQHENPRLQAALDEARRLQAARQGGPMPRSDDAQARALAAQTLPPVPPPPTAAHQERTRQWCRVQRGRVAQQRRAREEDA